MPYHYLLKPEQGQLPSAKSAGVQPSIRSRTRPTQPLADVFYLLADTNHTWLVWPNGERQLMARTLKQCEVRLLKTAFVRPNRHCVINLRYVVGVENALGKLSLILQNGECVRVERRHWNKIRQVMAAQPTNSEPA